MVLVPSVDDPLPAMISRGTTIISGLYGVAAKCSLFSP